MQIDIRLLAFDYSIEDNDVTEANFANWISFAIQSEKASTEQENDWSLSQWGSAETKNSR